METTNTNETQISKDESSIKGISLKNVFTVGGLIGLTIAGGFIVRAYLDILRIRRIKKGEKINMDD
mgnify:CR=1 FL=1